MATKKRDLEIIYNVQWKNKRGIGGDKSNIIGMYDIPSTTLNWETFKSYLLKNSGLLGEDVKVCYITDSDREFPIESQTDFQIALYAFRRKARAGDLVNLRLQSVSEPPATKNGTRYSNDAETQFDNNEATSITSTCCNSDSPPDWFIMFMNQFKKEIMEDVTATVSSIVSNMKPSIPIQSTCYHMRKSKAESSKRIRKLQPLISESSHDAKDLLKSLKLESKLERKLEKMEYKSKKARDKKLSMLTKSSDSEAGQSSSRSRSQPKEREDEILQMDATPINIDGHVPHFLGGEIYLCTWEVKNTGKLPWTSKTLLMFTWGSKALKPLDTIVSVPYLKPGDSGNISVRLQIPGQPGDYECYWHFHHKERRFGHWLGCRVIVDPFDLKGNSSVLETTHRTDQFTHIKMIPTAPEEICDIDSAVTHYGAIDETTSSSNTGATGVAYKNDFGEIEKNVLLVNEKQGLCSRLEDLKLQDPTDTNCSSDSDNQSIISLAESYGSKEPDEFVVVDEFAVPPENIPSTSASCIQHQSPLKDDRDEGIVEDSAPTQSDEQINYDNNNNTGETNQNISENQIKDETASNCSNDSDIIIVTLPKDEDQNDKYAYIIVDGQKLPIPKKLIKSEYLESAEKLLKSRASSSNSSVEVINKSEVPSPVSTSATDVQTDSTVVMTKPDIANKSDLLPSINSHNPTEVSDKPTSPLSTQATKASSERSLPEIGNSNVQINLGEHFITTDDLTSHCSATGSCFSDVNAPADKNSRLFIFPQNYPGYEVYHPCGDVHSVPQEYTWSNSGTQYAFTFGNVPPPQTTVTREPLNLSTHDQNPFSCNNTNIHIPNYQQTPPEQRSSPVYFDATAHFESVPNASIPTSHPSSGPQVTSTAPTAPPSDRRENIVHILPETLVSGAVNVASSAINTARSVINMIRPQEMATQPTSTANTNIPTQPSSTSNTNIPTQHTNTDFQQAGRWVNGHWVSTNPDSSREANLQALAEMGFWDRDLNATLLARYNDDLSRVVAELVQ